MPGPDLEPLPPLVPELVDGLRVEYAAHTPSRSNSRYCRCGRPNPCQARQAIYTRLVAAGYPPDAASLDDRPPLDDEV